MNVELDGKRAIIDVRERILNGEHPRNEIFDYVKQAPLGTVFEIHVPKKAQPLVQGLENLGMNVIRDELEAAHYRLTAIKLMEM
ncbi:amino acid decarboxylase [Virgibacillus profundi]|uniref:amino acid decarboxylase n=1 Tax=Virgibacillus profundi TaxID=2024555 RepID=UPI001F0AC008|nr:amino acid decarboxylase [Virgibacillus profundi]